MDDLDLAEYLITSKAEKILSKENEIKIEVTKAKGNKCPRCWKILEQDCSRCSACYKMNFLNKLKKVKSNFLNIQNFLCINNHNYFPF